MAGILMAGQQPAPAFDMDEYNRQVIAEFRANGGRVGGRFAGVPMLLLTTRGAKSGRERTTPLVCRPEGEALVIVASKAGAPTHPAWYHNIVAHPDVTVEFGTETFPARARIARGDERERLYAAQAAMLPVFNDYRARTARQIPVVVLERTGVRGTP